MDPMNSSSEKVNKRNVSSGSDSPMAKGIDVKNGSDDILVEEPSSNVPDTPPPSVEFKMPHR
jgi:hypothetical protein